MAIDFDLEPLRCLFAVVFIGIVILVDGIAVVISRLIVCLVRVILGLPFGVGL